MSDTLHSDDDQEHSAASNSDDEKPDADTHGEPLQCDECGEYVAVHYHPQGEFPAHYAGFVAHCNCAMGAQLDEEAVDELHPPWYLETVQENEAKAEEWIAQYLDDNRDISNWIGGDGDE